MQKEAIDELVQIISNNFPEVALWIPIVKPRLVNDPKFMQDMQQWVYKYGKQQKASN